MPHQTQVIPDPFEFARRSDVLSGACDARSFARLAEALQDVGHVQAVQYALSGFSVDDQHFLSVVATAELTMQCQRCLGDVPCVVEVDARLLLIPQGEELPDEGLENDDFDPVHAGRNFDVLAAVEEELLLVLPLAPTHDDCSVPAAKENGDDRSPFALLKGFKAKS